MAVLSEAGVQDERVAYSAYGVPFGMPAGDTDSDGDFDTNDQGAIAFWEMMSTYDVRGDVNLDGSVTSADAAAATTESLGWEVLSGIDSRKGYASYEHAPELAGTSYHVRYRVLKADLGRWLTRDPEGYSDGMSLYGYVQGMAGVAVDPMGLMSCLEKRELGMAVTCGKAGAPPTKTLPAPPPPPSQWPRYPSAAVPLPNPGPGLPGIPLRFPGPTTPIPFPSPSPGPGPCKAPGVIGLCFIVGGVSYCIGREIGKTIPPPAPRDLPPPKWPPRGPDRDPNDCSNEALAALMTAQKAACGDSDGRSTYDPCARMRSKSSQACAKAAEILGCIVAREAVSAFHRRCDAQRGVPPDESRRRYDDHRKRIRMLSKAMNTCNKKCVGADKDYVWWWD